MKTDTQPKLRLAAGGLLLTSTLALGGCFFGGVDDPAASSGSSGSSGSAATVPSSARSLNGFFDFLRNLANSETAEPLALGDFTPETSETAPSQNL